MTQEESKDPQSSEMAETIISLLRSKVVGVSLSSKLRDLLMGDRGVSTLPGAVNKRWELHKHCFILPSQHKGYMWEWRLPVVTGIQGLLRQSSHARLVAHGQDRCP